MAILDYLKRQSVVLRWWFMFTMMCVGIYFSYEAGLIQRFFEVDITHISSIIFSIFIVFSLIVGNDSRLVSKHGLLGSVCTRVKVGWFFSDVLMTLGMLGTVAGFILMLEGDITVAKAALAGMSKGMGVALYTTAAGMACGLVLKLQLFNLSTCLEDLQESTTCDSKE